MSFEIIRFVPELEAKLVALSMRAWAPVFEKLKLAVQPYVYRAFYPNGWQARQTTDIRDFLGSEGQNIWIAVEAGEALGWVGIRTHPADSMGEIYIIAVDPAAQRRGVATALLEHAISELRSAGMRIVMVETGDDPGHRPSRATYESAGFERWPVARYFRKI